jgi:hypothetical protein
MLMLVKSWDQLCTGWKPLVFAPWHVAQASSRPDFWPWRLHARARRGSEPSDGQRKSPWRGLAQSALIERYRYLPPVAVR